MKILIAGGSGLIGSALREYWTSVDHEVKILSRSEDGDHVIRWTPDKYDIESDETFDVVVNLSGAGLADEGWSRDRKETIQHSRIRSIETLDRYFQRVDFIPDIYINASAIGIYGDGGDQLFTEEDPPTGTDFLVETCLLWEKKVDKMISQLDRNYIVRFGVVLSNEGGAFPELSRGRSLGVVPHIGSGDQYVSWIHITDVVGALDHLIQRKPDERVYNIVAPQPVSNKELADLISDRKGLGFSPKIPAFVIKTMLGERSIIVLNSTRVSSKRLEDTGFSFRYRSVERALDDLLQ